MVDSKEFAVGIFDALARRRRQKMGRITKEELRDFWLQISDQSFDARLQIFFDMYYAPPLLPPNTKIIPSLIHMFFFRADSNADGRITRKEVQEVRLINLFQSHYSLWAGHPWMKAMFSSYELNHLMASLENFIHHKWTATISILICH